MPRSVIRRYRRAPRRHPPGLEVAVFVWFLGALALAYSSSAQTDPRIQAYFSAGLVLALFIFKRMNPDRRVPHFFEPREGLFSTDF